MQHGYYRHDKLNLNKLKLKFVMVIDNYLHLCMQQVQDKFTLIVDITLFTTIA